MRMRAHGWCARIPARRTSHASRRSARARARTRPRELDRAQKALAESVPPDTPLAELLAAAGRGDALAVDAILDQHPGIINERGTADRPHGPAHRAAFRRRATNRW